LKVNLPTLLPGQIAVTTDTHEFFVGIPDGNLPINGDQQNKLINGNFDIWQIGTSFANTGGLQYYADQWSGYASTLNQACTISKQDGSGVNGSVSCLRFQRNLGQTGTNGMLVAQSLEAIDSKKLLGKKLTLSFWARIGSDASSSSLAALIVSGTGTDQNVASGFTGAANEATLTANLTTTWQKFTVTTTSTIASTKTQLGIQLSYTPLGVAGANDYFEITQVQVNVGDLSLPFQPRCFADELAMCQRYYEKSFQIDFVPANGSTATALGDSLHATSTISQGNISSVTIPFKVRKRINPTVSAYGNNGGKFARGLAGAAITWDGDSSNTNISAVTTGLNIYPLASIFTYTALHWTADARL
jgi:hypothetical protein